jgi:hypothetical protein
MAAQYSLPYSTNISLPAGMSFAACINTFNPSSTYCALLVRPFTLEIPFASLAYLAKADFLMPASITWFLFT